MSHLFTIQCHTTTKDQTLIQGIIQTRRILLDGCFFLDVPSIQGFISLLIIICMETRYSFLFPTRHKYPPLATITWFIRTLHRQGYPVLYIQTDEGGELGQSTDFLQLLMKHDCVFMGTGKSGSSMNTILCLDRKETQFLRHENLGKSCLRSGY